jgi:L-rhamnose isomerase
MSSKRLRRTFRGDLAAKLAADRKSKGGSLGMVAVLEQLDRYGKTWEAGNQLGLVGGGCPTQ